MTLTEQDKQKFIEWLDERGAADFTCMICSSKEFAVLDDITYIPTGTKSGIENIGVICNCCKNTLLFNATESGVIDK